MTIRIWHQSTTELEKLPGYAKMLSEHATRVCGEDVEVALHGIDPGSYPDGVAPVELAGYPLAMNLIDQQIMRNCVRAQEQGFDAVALSSFRDPGLELARSLVDIPVVGICQSSLFVAATMGTRLALLTLDRNMDSLLEDLVDAYGFNGRVLRVASPEPPLREFELDEAFVDPSHIVERMTHEASKLVEAGADVIIPAEGVLNVLLVHAGVQSVDEVPVLDAWGALLHFTVMIVQLQRRTGLAVGRTGAYARLPEAAFRSLRQRGAAGWDDGSGSVL